jgi:hypothetical protein
MSAELILAGIVIVALQVLAALPWVWAIDPQGFRKWSKSLKVWGYIGGGVLVGGAVAGWLISQRGDVIELTKWGRILGSILHFQLGIDFLILVPQLLLLVWPKGGVVALAALREGIRQPMFWLIFILGGILITVSMVVPYFTFGEEYKMMKQLAFDVTMLAPALFGLLAASISINEEIEGRTAITLMSKPINRRQFLLGKYVGLLLACWAMTMLLGWLLTWALNIKPFFDKLEDVLDTMPIESQEVLIPFVKNLLPSSQGGYVAVGMGAWFGETFAHHIGVLLGFGQVMVLLAICVALATRMQFVVNLSICLIVFLIGRLAPVLVDETATGQQSGNTALQLVNFIAQLLNAVFPALEYFDIGPAIIRDQQVLLSEFMGYVGTVFAYALLYTGIALLIGLILFDDKDLA